MECKKYHATIPESTCIARQKRAATKWEPGVKGEADPGCKDCEQGRKVMGEQVEGKDEHPPAIGRAGRTPDRLASESVAGRSNEITHTCKNPDCGHVGPLDDFPKNNASKDGHTNECKKCQSKRSSENAKKRREKADAEITAKVEKDLRLADADKKPAVQTVGKPDYPGDICRAGTITINFTGYPELYEQLLKTAKEDVRTPEGQCLYLLKEVIKMIATPGG